MLLLFIFSHYKSYHKCSNNIFQEPDYDQSLLTIGSITISLIALLLEISKKLKIYIQINNNNLYPGITTYKIFKDRK